MMIALINTFCGNYRPGMLKKSAFPGRILLATGISLMIMLLRGSAPVLAQEAIQGEEPTPSTVQESAVPMERSFQEKPSRPGFFPSLKEQLKDTDPFVRDTKLDLNFRTYYFDRNKFDNSESTAWALGGSLAYRSGWFLDRFGVGATLYTSQPLYAPDHKDGTSLLKPGQEGYTVVGQLYGRVKVANENFINIYRYEYNTPYINKKDLRMTPYTFEGYTFTGASGGKDGAPKFNYGGGYIDKIKLWNADRFISMSRAAGADVSRGVVLGGANAAFTTFTIGAIDYYSEDIINIGYAEAKYTTKLTGQVGILFAAQFTDQRSTGDDLLTGSSFKTSQSGVKAEMSGAGGGIITLAYTTNSEGADLQNPWSSFPGYTSVQVQDFNRAGETAFMIKGSYDFSRLGLEGVTAYALLVHGWGAVNPLTKAEVYNQNEVDYDIQWKPKSGGLKGLWLRVRYADIDQRGVGDATMDDFRVIVNYDLALL